ncbi:histidinol-phosphate transaminase [Nisaea sp.]|uniref:pyridoxal phosphate-dependent aminotransferase n=1 Tax=Nisaea sp. TaxID=2024842 RepID=UPI002B2697F0|nr:histidinol-phosphate transaminase [Nisaea sp.]
MTTSERWWRVQARTAPLRPNWHTESSRDPNFLWADKNENFDPRIAQAVQKTLRDLPNHLVGSYPDLGPVYSRLTDFFSVDNGQALITNGVDEGIRLTFQLAQSTGRSIFMTAPTFAMYSVYAMALGIDAQTFTYERHRSGFALDTDQIMAAIEKLKPSIVFLANPDSPTGSVIPPEVLLKIMDRAGKNGTILFIDEAYYPYSEETLLGEISGQDNLLVARSFDKAFGLAGFRLGALFGNEGLIDSISRRRSMYEIGAVQAFVLERMLKKTSLLSEVAHDIRNAKREFEARICSLGFEVIPTDGNFSLILFGDQRDLVRKKLEKTTLYRDQFGHPSMQDISRISIVSKGAANSIAFQIEEAVSQK